MSCRLWCQANVAPLQEAGRSLLQQGHRDLTPSERRDRISQHIWHVEHWKLGAVLHGRHLARSWRSFRYCNVHSALAARAYRTVQTTIVSPQHQHKLSN